MDANMHDEEQLLQSVDRYTEQKREIDQEEDLSMKCPKCGNEVGPDEAFCGQCGTPNMPPARPTEMVNTPSPRSGYLNTRNVPGTGIPGTQGVPGTPVQNGAFPAGNSAVMPPTRPFQSMPSPASSSPFMSNGAPVQQQPPAWPNAPQQPTGFYQDATEAIPSMPDNGQSYPGAYPQQNFPGAPMPGAYPGTGMLGSQPPQPFQTGQPAPYGGASYSPIPGYTPGQGYTGQSKLTPPPQKQTSVALIIACIFLVIALLAAVAFGTLYLTRHSSPKVISTPTTAPTAAPSPTAIPSPTATLAPTPTTAPSPTAAPTPAPDPNFTWCDTTCTSNGYLVEYPSGWQQGQTSDATGVMFTNPAQTDEYAAFKTPGVTSSSASQLIENDLQTNFASKPGYQVTTPISASTTMTIGGETWTYEIATYQQNAGPAGPNNTMEQIAVYATVHQGKAYIIELQAPQSLYDTANSQYFQLMLNKFQFLSATTPTS